MPCAPMGGKRRIGEQSKAGEERVGSEEEKAEYVPAVKLLMIASNTTSMAKLARRPEASLSALNPIDLKIRGRDPRAIVRRRERAYIGHS